MMTISLTGSKTASAGEICIQRHAAEDCLRKAEKFDDLAAEARAIRTQRDECAGRLGEARDGVGDCRDSVRSLEAEVARLTADLESVPSRRQWLGIGAGVGGIAFLAGSIVISR